MAAKKKPALASFMVTGDQPYKDRDRFIPTYQPSLNSSQNTSNKSCGSIDLVIEGRKSDRARSSFESVGSDRVSSQSSGSTPKFLIPSRHQGGLAQALGIPLGAKIFRFGGRNRKPTDEGKDLTNKLAGENLFENSNNKPKPKVYNNSSKIPILYAAPANFKVDFYTNLVSWSVIHPNKVIIGIGRYAFTWIPLTNRTETILGCKDNISCVSCSYGDLVAVGSFSGELYILSQKSFQVYACYVPENREGNCIHSIVWFKDGKRLLISDHCGDVLYLELNETRTEIKLIYTFQVHQQLVCALNIDETQVAFGSNDNTVSIWNLPSLVLKYILPHRAAIKAIAFCPWCKSLLATGGGGKDRTIKFWHSSSGTFLSSFFTDSQITALYWNRFTKEIVATYGHGDNGSILSVYKYPEMVPVRHVTSTNDKRILSASLSVNGTELCVGTNDQTVRVYKLWENKKSSMLAPNFESSLIELCEGLDVVNSIIR